MVKYNLANFLPVPQLVRRWKLGLLTPAASDALFCHNYSVRSIAAGPDEMLVSGDAGGEVAVWVV